MNGFSIDARLQAESHALGRLDGFHLRLVDKAEVPWFLLVPETDVIELCDLDDALAARLLSAANALARFVRAHFTQVKKLNVASIGNVVPQIHVHVIGRHPGDPWWPGGVWGQASAARYDARTVESIRAALAAALGATYVPG